MLNSLSCTSQIFSNALRDLGRMFPDIKIVAIRHVDCNVLGLNCRLYEKIAILSEIFHFREYGKMSVFTAFETKILL